MEGLAAGVVLEAPVERHVKAAAARGRLVDQEALLGRREAFQMVSGIHERDTS